MWNEYMAKVNRMLSETDRLGKKTRNNTLDTGQGPTAQGLHV